MRIYFSSTGHMKQEISMRIPEVGVDPLVQQALDFLDMLAPYS